MFMLRILSIFSSAIFMLTTLVPFADSLYKFTVFIAFLLLMLKYIMFVCSIKKHEKGLEILILWVFAYMLSSESFLHLPINYILNILSHMNK